MLGTSSSNMACLAIHTVHEAEHIAFFALGGSRGIVGLSDSKALNFSERSENSSSSSASIFFFPTDLSLPVDPSGPLGWTPMSGLSYWWWLRWRAWTGTTDYSTGSAAADTPKDWCTLGPGTGMSKCYYSLVFGTGMSIWDCMLSSLSLWLLRLLNWWEARTWQRLHFPSFISAYSFSLVFCCP